MTVDRSFMSLCDHSHRQIPYTTTPEPPKGFKGKPPTLDGTLCTNCKLFRPLTK